MSVDGALRVQGFAFRGLLGIAMLALCGTGIAAPTLVGPTTDPTGINGLVVDDVAYNVTFSITAFDSPFMRGTAASQDAATAVAAVFSSAGVTELGGTALMPFGFYLIYVDSGFDQFGLSEGTHCEVNSTGGSCSPSNWTFDGGAAVPLGAFVPIPGAAPFTYAMAADFTPVSSNVPEPASIALFCAGLLGIGLRRRRLVT